ncbi:MAG: hypothetical protein CVU46_06555 [Chloroflexi bacterium HGW-Chloroflexi-8]|nr:MAG: hypothetical protein CVU46_06555 [Chloroflexi bacterium HGW-Chloroflexi-8]
MTGFLPGSVWLIMPNSDLHCNLGMKPLFLPGCNHMSAIAVLFYIGGIENATSWFQRYKRDG